MSVAQAASQNNSPEAERKSETDIVIETRNLGKVYRDFWGRKKVQALKVARYRSQTRRGFWTARTQWFRKVDHD